MFDGHYIWYLILWRLYSFVVLFCFDLGESKAVSAEMPIYAVEHFSRKFDTQSISFD